MKVILTCVIFWHIFSKSTSDPSYGGYRTAFITSDDGASSDSGNQPNLPDPKPPPPPPPAPPDTFSTDSKASLTIYYDPMDPDSQKYFKTYLVNQCGGVSAHIDITFVPCQQAQVIGDLICPPVDELCQMDKIHSCAINRITDKTLLVNYLACSMFTPDRPYFEFSKCAGPSKADDHDLEKCANGKEGKDMCKDYASKKLGGLDTLPGFVFKPPAEINPGYLYENFDFYRGSICLKDLPSAVCAKLVASKAANLPEECKKKIVLGIFYKAMDSKSQKWFQSFSKVYDEFSDYFTFEYRPCMQAEVTWADITDNSDTVDCKDENDHDCIAGRTHVCAASIIQDPKTLFHFLDCTMRGTAQVPNFEKCATDNKVEYDPIKKCARGDEGKKLCLASAKEHPNTEDFPSFSYELTFDKETSKKTADATDQTLKTTFCDELKKYGVANPCDQKNHAGVSSLPSVPSTVMVKPPPASTP